MLSFTRRRRSGCVATFRRNRRPRHQPDGLVTIASKDSRLPRLLRRTGTRSCRDSWSRSVRNGPQGRRAAAPVGSVCPSVRPRPTARPEPARIRFGRLGEPAANSLASRRAAARRGSQVGVLTRRRLRPRRAWTPAGRGPWAASAAVGGDGTPFARELEVERRRPSSFSNCVGRRQQYRPSRAVRS